MDTIQEQSSRYAKSYSKNSELNVVVPLLLDVDVVKLRSGIELQNQANELMMQLENVSF